MANNYTIDRDGRVHYADGSVGEARETWQDENGRTVYSQNSKGPASTAGGAYVYQGGAAPDTPSGTQINYDGSVTPVRKSAYEAPAQQQGGAVFGGKPASYFDGKPYGWVPPGSGGYFNTVTGLVWYPDAKQLAESNAMYGNTTTNVPEGGFKTTPGATPGTGTGGGLLGSASTTNTTGSIDRQVDAAKETVEGRVNNILAQDGKGGYTNPVVQQAANTAMQQFAGRGLLNSSMATEAASQAAISKAIEIAGPDAQAYYNQGRANQDAQNVFQRDTITNARDVAKQERGYQNEQITLDKNLAFNREQLQLKREEMAQSGSQFNKELQFKYDSFQLGETSRKDAAELAQKYSIEINSIKAVDGAYDLYLRRISDIDNNKDWTPEVKTQMKNSAGTDFDIYAKAKGIVYEQQFGGRYEETPAPKPVSPPGIGPNNQQWAGPGGLLDTWRGGRTEEGG